MSGLLITVGDDCSPSDLRRRMPMELTGIVTGDRYGVALAQSTLVFPLAEPVVDGDRVHVLRGYAWGPSGMPKSEADGADLVRDMGRRLERDGHLFAGSDEVSGLFTLCTVTPDAIYLASDPSGLYPVYSWSGSGRAAVSSHERVIARLASTATDLRGVVQTAAFGYTIGERTLHRGVRQLPAGSSARLDRTTGDLVVHDHPDLYGPIVEGQSIDDVADLTWSQYVDGLDQMALGNGRSGIFMSGGFDTRLVALGLVAAGRDLVALTIGDEGNHEVGMARKLAELAGADWQARTAVGDLDQLEASSAEMVSQAESLCFPTCWFGSEQLRTRGATSLSSGYGGETILGGHGGTRFLGATDRSRRLLDVARRGTRRAPVGRREITRTGLDPVVLAMERQHRHDLERLANRVAPGLRAEVAAAAAEVGEEIRAELERYLASRPTALEQIAERFWLDHHVRKHYGRQEMTLDAVLPLLLPTLSSKFLIGLSTVDPHLKVDHRMYLRMIRRHFGPYASIPTSNVPVPLSLPSPVIWGARSFRAAWDDRQTALQVRSKGARGKRFGWSNFEVWARQSTLFDQLPRMIAPWLIDPAWLDRKLAKQQSWDERFYSGQEHLIFATVSAMVDP